MAAIKVAEYEGEAMPQTLILIRHAELRQIVATMQQHFTGVVVITMLLCETNIGFKEFLSIKRCESLKF